MNVVDELLETLKGPSSVPTKAILCIGGLAILSFAKQLLSAFFKYFLRPGKNLKKLGEWAVITGATDGIGKAYAKALAKKGFNIVLISRTESKLIDTKDEITAKYPSVSVKYVVCDYSKFDQASTQATVKSAISGLQIGILINNVGVSYRYPQFFHELSDEEGMFILGMRTSVMRRESFLANTDSQSYSGQSYDFEHRFYGLDDKDGSPGNAGTQERCHRQPFLWLGLVHASSSGRVLGCQELYRKVLSSYQC